MEAVSIVVTSGKGGVGKTTCTANLGMALARMGHQVCLIDTDTGLRNLDLILGMEHRIVFDLVDVARGTCRVEQALVRDRRDANLAMLPTSQRYDKSALTPADMRAVVASLRNLFDYILIDCPAGVEEGFFTAISAADEALVVLNPEVSSVRDADRVLGMLFANGVRNVRLVVNRTRPEMIERNDMLSPGDIGDLLRIPTLAVLPEDTRVLVSTNRGEPVVLDRTAKSARIFEQMARAIVDKKLCISPIEEPGIVGRLKAFFAGAAAAG